MKNYHFEMETLKILLTRGMVALIDAEDLEVVSSYSWAASKSGRTFYAVSAGSIYLHRVIMGDPADMEVDHRNGDGLDCRKENLRRATHQQNQANQRLSAANTSGYKGVVRVPRSRWQAQTRYCGKMMYLGTFKMKEDAARAYDAKMWELHGEFARLNFPRSA